MNDLSLKSHSKTVVIIGDFELDSIEDKRAALGHSFKNINPLKEDFKFENMKKYLNRIRNSGKLLAVIIFLSDSMIMHVCTSGLVEKWLDLLEEMKNEPLIIFINEDNFLGLFRYELSLWLEIQYKERRLEV